MRVLVTGASGFLGSVACAQLNAAGHDVHALVRRPGSAPPGTIPATADLTDSAALATAVAAAAPDAVLHLAAEIATQRDEARIRAVNVDGTRALLEACAASGSPKVVFTSTVVTGDAHGELLTEDNPLPVTTPYGHAKQEGEALLAKSGLPWVVLRPSHVYGPGGWYIDDLVARLRQPGRLCVIGNGKNLWDVVHVDDVAAACVLAIEKAPSGSLFHCVDDTPISFYDFMALTAEQLGLGKPRRVPAALARLAAGKHAVTAVVRSARSSNAKLKRELGWEPRYPSAREGIPAALSGV